MIGWRTFLFLPFVALSRALEKILWFVPDVKAKRLDGKLNLKTVHYLEVPEQNWRLASGTVFRLVLVGTWLYLGVANFHSLKIWVTIIYPLNVLICAIPLRHQVNTIWSLIFGERVLVGDIRREADDKAVELAYRMAENAIQRKVKMRLINRGETMRAYFRNDDEMVLIRAAS